MVNDYEKLLYQEIGEKPLPANILHSNILYRKYYSKLCMARLIYERKCITLDECEKNKNVERENKRFGRCR